MSNKMYPKRRRILLTAATIVGGVGATYTAVPFVAYMMPSERAKNLGADIEVDISNILPGKLKTVSWRGKPVWTLKRTPEMLDSIIANEDRFRDPNSEKSIQPDYADNMFRSINSEYLVVVGICTHLGYIPKFIPEHGANGIGSWWKGGFSCPCHSSEFDLSGRVFKGRSPAPMNLIVPPYKFVSNSIIRIGNLGDHA